MVVGFLATCALASGLKDYVIFGCAETPEEHKIVVPLVLKRMEDGTISYIPSTNGIDLSEQGRYQVTVNEPVDGVFLINTAEGMARVSDEGLVVVAPKGDPVSFFCTRIDLPFLNAMEGIGSKAETLGLVADELADRATDIAAAAASEREAGLINENKRLEQQISDLGTKLADAQETKQSRLDEFQALQDELKRQLDTIEGERDALEWYAVSWYSGRLTKKICAGTFQASSDLGDVNRELRKRLGRALREVP